jgi:hypothetical protein
MRFACTTAVALVSLLSLVACAEDEIDGAPAVSEDEVRVRPSGVDDDKARLFVKGVPGVAASKVILEYFEGTKATNEAWDVLISAAVADHVVTVDSSAPGIRVGASVGVRLERGKETVVHLAALRVKRAGTENVLGLQGSTIYSDGASRGVYPNAAFEVQSGVATTAALHVPADYTHVVRWGILDGVVFEGAAAGKSSTLDFNRVGSRQRAKLVAPKRELPDACTAGGVDPGAVEIAGYGEKTVGGLGSADLVVGFNPEIAALSQRGPKVEGVTYRLPCGLPMPLAYSAPGGTAKVTTIGRIDVDHVEVTLPGGATETRPGRYRIYAGATTTTPIHETDFPTNTGIDVPPGSYTVVTTYTSNSGETKTSVSRVTTP